MGITDDITRKISDTLDMSWTVRDGVVVPKTDDVNLAGGAVKLDATFLFADLAESSRLATEFQKRTAAKTIRAFLGAVADLVSHKGGAIRSFDGDRIMGVFVGDSKNTSAAECALYVKYFVTEVLKPKLEDRFTAMSSERFSISHGVGVDTGEVLVVRAGRRGDNDLVWVGRAPNSAARLSDIRDGDFQTYISSAVYASMNKSVKESISKPGTNMWQERTVNIAGEQRTAYRSSWWRSP